MRIEALDDGCKPKHRLPEKVSNSNIDAHYPTQVEALDKEEKGPAPCIGSNTPDDTCPMLDPECRTLGATRWMPNPKQMSRRGSQLAS